MTCWKSEGSFLACPVADVISICIQCFRLWNLRIRWAEGHRRRRLWRPTI